MTEPTTPNLTTAQEIKDAIISRYNAQNAYADVNKLLAEWKKHQSEGQKLAREYANTNVNDIQLFDRMKKLYTTINDIAELYKPICDILKISNDMHAEAELLESKCNPQDYYKTLRTYISTFGKLVSKILLTEQNNQQQPLTYNELKTNPRYKEFFEANKHGNPLFLLEWSVEIYNCQNDIIIEYTAKLICKYPDSARGLTTRGVKRVTRGYVKSSDEDTDDDTTQLLNKQNAPKKPSQVNSLVNELGGRMYFVSPDKTDTVDSIEQVVTSLNKLINLITVGDDIARFKAFISQFEYGMDLERLFIKVISAKDTRGIYHAFSCNPNKPGLIIICKEITIIENVDGEDKIFTSEKPLHPTHLPINSIVLTREPILYVYYDGQVSVTSTITLTGKGDAESNLFYANPQQDDVSNTQFSFRLKTDGNNKLIDGHEKVYDNIVWEVIRKTGYSEIKDNCYVINSHDKLNIILAYLGLNDIEIANFWFYRSVDIIDGVRYCIQPMLDLYRSEHVLEVQTDNPDVEIVIGRVFLTFRKADNDNDVELDSYLAHLEANGFCKWYSSKAVYETRPEHTIDRMVVSEWGTQQLDVAPR
jgi:hypothetical protein